MRRAKAANGARAPNGDAHAPIDAAAGAALARAAFIAATARAPRPIP
jgi:hypothetical protein